MQVKFDHLVNMAKTKGSEVRVTQRRAVLKEIENPVARLNIYNKIDLAGKRF